jgi:deazaflavin-dependent oxidoreductase (nitroreductase family)
MDFWVKTLMAINIFLYRLTGGVLGGRMSGQNVLLLTTVGRKSGKERITPVNYFRDGENYLLVGSNWGKPGQAAWYLNLMQRPEACIQVKRQVLKVAARPADETEYPRLWAYVTSLNPFYPRYQAQTHRRIPIVILTPQKPG